MPHTIVFDTLEYTKILKNAGVPEGQAEAQARALSFAITDFQEERLESLATKSDIINLERDI